jgi:aspartate/methionine/tyrosine aminotransferase
VLLADEVYQENIYDDNAEFVSAKRAAWETGLLEQDAIELVSFHSTSKGLYGECGHRGGYMELVGFDEKVKGHLYKLASSGLCPNLDGQIMMDLMVRGPQPGTESYEKHEAERSAIFNSLKSRAKLVAEGLDSIPGFHCNPAQGAMYCFPSVDIPEAAVKEAEAKGQTPDTLYALSVLENTGICVVPASGFHQKPGRYGFRTTFLPPEEEMKRAVALFRRHHEDFCKKYAEEPVAA